MTLNAQHGGWCRCSVKPAHVPSRQRGTTKGKGHSQCQVAQGFLVGSTKHKRAMRAGASTEQVFGISRDNDDHTPLPHFPCKLLNFPVPQFPPLKK